MIKILILTVGHLIKCLQILPNFAYIWGVSLRLPDLACPIEVGRPYLHLLADH